MIFDRTLEFNRELKILKKKWPSLPDDLLIIEQVIKTLYVDLDGVDRSTVRKNFFNSKRATILSQTEAYEVIKMRVDCASLGNKDSVRLVCVFIVTKETALFVELYSKTGKPRENTARWQKYSSNCVE